MAGRNRKSAAESPNFAAQVVEKSGFQEGKFIWFLLRRAWILLRWIWISLRRIWFLLRRIWISLSQDLAASAPPEQRIIGST
jgi:hypothetical protein